MTLIVRPSDRPSCPTVRPLICTFVRTSAVPPARLPVRPSVCPSVRQSARPSARRWLPSYELEFARGRLVTRRVRDKLNNFPIADVMINGTYKITLYAH